MKLHRAEAGTRQWTEIDSPKYPVVNDANSSQDADSESPGTGPSVQQIWELVTGGEDQPGVLWAGTIPGGLFKSEDNGSSWRLIDSLWQRPEREFWFGGGYDDAGIHSICVDPRDSQHLCLAISCGGVWESIDGGDNWQQ